MITQNDSDDGPLPTWTIDRKERFFEEITKIDHSAGMGTDALIVYLRQSLAHVLVMSAQTWKVLEPIFKKPAVPTGPLVTIYDGVERAGSSC